MCPAICNNALCNIFSSLSLYCDVERWPWRRCKGCASAIPHKLTTSTSVNTMKQASSQLTHLLQVKELGTSDTGQGHLPMRRFYDAGAWIQGSNKAAHLSQCAPPLNLQMTQCTGGVYLSVRRSVPQAHVTGLLLRRAMKDSLHHRPAWF